MSYDEQIENIDIDTVNEKIYILTEKKYSCAVSLKQEADCEKDSEVKYQEIIGILKSIPNYKNSLQLIKDCELKLEKIKTKRLRNIAITVVASIVIIFICSFAVANIKNNKARKLFENGQYEQAYKVLGKVDVPKGVTSIGVGAFKDQDTLTSITIPNSVTCIDRYAFEGCSNLTSITIPNSVTFIEQCAFKDCSRLTNIIIPDSVTAIGPYAFEWCSSLTSITIPDSVTAIVDWTFVDCRNLKSVTIPKSVTHISAFAFVNCDSLKTIYYTGTKEEWNALQIDKYNTSIYKANMIYNYVP